jgi:hypothetical protein
MPAEPPVPAEPGHPLHALTTYELRGYRRALENSLADSAAHDPASRDDLQARLAAVLAEQDSRAELTSYRALRP